MDKKRQGFGLIELMIAIIVAVVILIGTYKYWIASVKNMHNTTNRTEISKAVLNTCMGISSDLEFMGYNPRELTTPSTCTIGPLCTSMFGVETKTETSLLYSFYNPDALPVSGAPTCLDTWCTRVRYTINAGTITKSFYDASLSVQPQTMILLNNACMSIVFWNAATNSACPCQDGRKCQFTNIPNQFCTDRVGQVPPTMVRLVVAKNPAPQDGITFGPDCTILGTDSQRLPALEAFARCERLVKLKNLN
jgi:prepilin-type N-terminal cleavage/methylation domain-containing protein